MARAVHKLTDRDLRTLQRKGAPGLHSDGLGLYFRVASPTACSWLLRYMLDGKAREMGLGSYPVISLAAARTAAGEARELKAKGIDPIDTRDATRARRVADAAKAVTFRHCAEAFIVARKGGWKNAKHIAQWTSSLEAYAMPTLGALPVASVDVTLVDRVLEPIWSSKTETASRLRGRIEAILDWAATRGYRHGENPARWRGHLENLFPRRSKVRPVVHHPALPYAKLPAFMAELKTENGAGGRALQFTILTTTRTREAIGAAWPEIDLDNAMWTIPGERMKAKREHRVPLSKPALAILRTQRELTDGQGYVFPGKPRRHLSGTAMLKVLAHMKRSDITVHGFRSTFRDWAAEQTNFPRDAAEMALAHAVGDKVEAAYRRGDMFEKRRKLAAAWATFCSAPQEETKVIHMRRSTANAQ